MTHPITPNAALRLAAGVIGQPHSLTNLTNLTPDQALEIVKQLAIWWDYIALPAMHGLSAPDFAAEPVMGLQRSADRFWLSAR